MSLDEDIVERPIPLDEDEAERVRLRIRRKLPGRRLDKYLQGRFPRLSRTAIQRLIKQGVITVNQHALTPDDLLDKCQRLVKLYPGHPVVIRSDKGTRYEHLVVVIDTCRKAGIGNLSFATAMTDEAAEPDALPAAEVGTLPRQP